MTYRTGAGLILALAWLPLSAHAQEGDPPPEEAPKTVPETAPDIVTLDGQFSQFLSTVAAGNGEGETRYGGRIDLYAKIDGGAAGIVDGLTINAQGEFIYGNSVNRVGSRTLLPVNTAMNFPVNDDEAFDLSVNIVQRIGKVRVQLGKINLLDSSSAIPIVAGGGKVGFQHIGLAAPPGLIASPKIFGGIVTVPAGRVVISAGVWHPEDWTREFIDGGLFGNGVSGMVAGTLPAKIGGKQGFHTVTIFATSRKPSAEGLPDIRPPEGSAPLLSGDRGGTHLRYAVQHYLWQDPSDPKRGFGLFGHAGISIGAPALLDWSMTAGLAGSVPIAARPRDRFGIGYFRFSLEDRIADGLAPVLPVGDEQGGEIYYAAQLGDMLQLTASAQLVDPVLANAPDAVNFNLRAVVAF